MKYIFLDSNKVIVQVTTTSDPNWAPNEEQKTLTMIKVDDRLIVNCFDIYADGQVTPATTPPPPDTPAPSLDQLQSQLDDIQSQIASISAQVTTIQSNDLAGKSSVKGIS
jgi:peptidoglycan hydrolase CwlO-like protein